MLLLVATTPVTACKLDGDEVVGAERKRQVPYPERLYTPRPRSAEEAAHERAARAPVEDTQRDGGLDDAAPAGRR